MIYNAGDGQERARERARERERESTSESENTPTSGRPFLSYAPAVRPPQMEPLWDGATQGGGDG